MARIRQEADRLQGCVWVHVTSAGEYEQARPVIRALKDLPPGQAPPVAVTHYSPSGYEYARKRPSADFHDYLPLDRLAAMRDLVRMWRPRLLVFVKYDFWPNQILAAAEAGVPIVLIAGTLQPRSWRLRFLARSLFNYLFNQFSHLGVCSEEDRRRFVDLLKVRCPVTVTGDTRAEQVIDRFEGSADGRVAARLQALPGTRLILGSTWPRDESLWLPVLPELLGRFPDLSVVLTPHEPRPGRLADLEAKLARREIASIRLSRLLETPAGKPDAFRCVLVDSVGVLAEIYRAGTIAYVGGSFTTGVHNTLEPAVASLPVLFGPVIQNALEASRLIQAGAGFVGRKPAEAAARLTALLADRADLARRGRLAREVVLAQKGATARSLALLHPFLRART